MIGQAVNPKSAIRNPKWDKPGRLGFLVPATLLPGTYNLEIRARMGRPPAGPDTRELRVGRLDATLTV